MNQAWISSRLCCLFVSLSLLMPIVASAHEDDEKSLYARLGGYDAIAAVVDEFIARLLNDEELDHFFVGFSTDSKTRIRQLVVDQVCEAAGGPCVYTGRDMKTSHVGIGITESDWNKAVDHLVGTLDKFEVPKKERDELLTVVGTLKADIVEK